MKNPIKSFFGHRRARALDKALRATAPNRDEEIKAAILNPGTLHVCANIPHPTDQEVLGKGSGSGASYPQMGPPCAECGGYFRPESLKSVPRIEVTTREIGGVGASCGPVFYCQSCVPEAEFVLVLIDSKGGELDTRFFRVEDGYLQDVDEETGEHQYVVSDEEYSHLYCETCGEFVAGDETNCRKHKAPEKKSKS